MPTWIALLRGINVGGRGKLPMQQFVALLQALGCTSGRTYVQSGNAVFHAAERDAGRLAGQIADAIETAHGFRPEVLVLDAPALRSAVERNPFPEAEGQPTRLHLFFLAAPPDDPDLAALDRLRAAGESFRLDGRVFYLHAPAGLGRSKLAAAVERRLGVAATARNWRTVCQVLEMATETT